MYYNYNKECIGNHLGPYTISTSLEDRPATVCQLAPLTPVPQFDFAIISSSGHSQRIQYPLIKEYNLNHNILAPII